MCCRFKIIRKLFWNEHCIFRKHLLLSLPKPNGCNQWSCATMVWKSPRRSYSTTTSKLIFSDSGYVRNIESCGLQSEFWEQSTPYWTLHNSHALHSQMMTNSLKFLMCYLQCLLLTHNTYDLKFRSIFKLEREIMAVLPENTTKFLWLQIGLRPLCYT